jgi:hypothetical protein
MSTISGSIHFIDLVLVRHLMLKILPSNMAVLVLCIMHDCIGRIVLGPLASPAEQDDCSNETNCCDDTNYNGDHRANR